MSTSLYLGIESSCDETAAAVVDLSGPKVLSNVIASQNAVHAEYGGVVPELASRQHLRMIGPVLRQALSEAGCELKDLSGIAVTYGPGLAGSLGVGLSAAKGLALAQKLPWLGVDHLEGHLLAAFLEHPGLSYPFLGLVVSGGHSSLYAVSGPQSRERLARTRDDAVGEAFDKVAKLLDLGFPGGPALDKAAAGYQGSAAPSFPVAQLKDGSLDFSFSGLKTSLRLHIEKAKAEGTLDIPAVAAGFQAAAIRPLISRALEAARRTGYTKLVVGGGVAANSYLRRELPVACGREGVEVFLPSLSLCVDNAAMIAYAGGLRLLKGERSEYDLGVAPNLGH